MSKLFLFIQFLFFTKTFFAQQQDSLTVEQKPIKYKKNAVYLEGLGNGILYSLNFEKQIGSGKKGFTSIRMGLHIADDGSDIEFMSPILLTHIFNKNSDSHFELGGGVSFLTFLLKKNFVLRD